MNFTVLDNKTVFVANDTHYSNSSLENKSVDILFFVYYYGIFIALTCINIPGNLLVLATVIKHHQLRQPCNYYIASLAFSDFLIGLVYPIYNIAHLEEAPDISRALANWSICRVVVCEVLALEICSSYHLVAITVTRYIAILHPLKYHIYVTTKTTTIAITVIWVLSQGSSLVMYTMYNPEHAIRICRYELIFSVTHVAILLVIQLFIPLSIMLGLYIRIAKVARRQAKIIAIQESCITGRCRTKNGIIKNELKSTVMVSLLLGCFTLSWTPMIIYFFYTIACTSPPCDANRYVRATVRVLLYFNSAVNVFIYAGRLSEFRVRIKADIKECFGRRFTFIKDQKPVKTTQTEMNNVSSLSKISANDETVETGQIS